MGDTKRGRERTGKKKREQLRKRDVERSLQATNEPTDPPEFPDGELSLGDR
ncbi:MULTISPECIES: hypothetical protein [Halobacterium]|uniref:Uncharacterized protein n=4 Tax=Halobacterium salinarum TaxID=2242 RepID=Q9HS53_HALSA|nr:MULTISPECIES: hypothetical protein [Halobacterium]AAG18955.1 hypothetical protein VNG_0402H [Halobacterium salinarum NRC-1]MBB6089788.1 hypothetical protein [Halobacterium salinarum]MCF2164121.1 hypothetical protein [Halobacterium salinarum]MCF2167803.1 hypothetical protein [Halobacterium salinarum]MCF2239229.1 hypothetical protein [Halobacterium salinarum]